MNVVSDILSYKDLPVFINQADRLKQELQTYSLSELQKLFACNEKIARLNYERYRTMNLYEMLSPAILSYEGIQYQYMAPSVFTDEEFAYIQDHLFILSGLYGILRPFDGIVSYRLEMQARLKSAFCENLYDFWSDLLYRDLVEDDALILNLASAEYSRCITRYLEPHVRIVRCVFAQRQKDGRIREKGVYVKMARGEMVRYMAEKDIERIEDIRTFDRQGYHFDEDRSDAQTYVFVNEEE